MKRIILLVLLLLVITMPASAQEIHLTVAENSLEQAAMAIFQLVFDITYLPFAAAFVLALTAILKRFISVPANVIAFACTILVWAGYRVAIEIGWGHQFETIIAALGTLGSSILGVLFTSVTSGYFYDKAKNSNVPILGYSRTELG
jgi:hypothetical protein